MQKSRIVQERWLSSITRPQKITTTAASAKVHLSFVSKKPSIIFSGFVSLPIEGMARFPFSACSGLLKMQIRYAITRTRTNLLISDGWN